MIVVVPLYCMCHACRESWGCSPLNASGLNRGRKPEEERGAPGPPVHAAAPNEHNWAPFLAAAAKTGHLTCRSIFCPRPPPPAEHHEPFSAPRRTSAPPRAPFGRHRPSFWTQKPAHGTTKRTNHVWVLDSGTACRRAGGNGPQNTRESIPQENRRYELAQTTIRLLSEIPQA